MGGEIRESLVDDHEFDLLLSEIPHATSHNLLHHHVDPHHSDDNHHENAYGVHVSAVTQKMNGLHNGNGMYGMYDDDGTLSHTCASPVSEFSLQSGGSSSSLFSGGCGFSDTGSPTPPQLEELKSQLPYGFWLESKKPDSAMRKKVNESLVDELGLSRNLSRMYISNGQEDAFSFRGSLADHCGFKYGAYHKLGKQCPDYTGLQSVEQADALNLRGSLVNPYGLQFRGSSVKESSGINVEKYVDYDNFTRDDSDYMGFQYAAPRTPTRFDGEIGAALSGLQQECRMGNLLGSQSPTGRFDALFSQLNICNIPVNSPRQNPKAQTVNHYQTRNPPSNRMNSLSRLSMTDSLVRGQQSEMNLNEDNAVLGSSYPQRHDVPTSNGKFRAHSNVRMAIEAFSDEDSLIIEGKALSALAKKGLDQEQSRYKNSLHGIGVKTRLERRSQLGYRPQGTVSCENTHNDHTYLPRRYDSSAEDRGYIYLIAKDQNGCRFLQKMFEEGSPRDVQIIFNEIIDHVVELMMNPFGNYLMQKLLDVCTEEQRMHILLVITERPSELIRISLNTHGTRVVQKLIETLKTRQQISLVVSALEPGVQTLLIDVNGNHVVQRCLQCLSNSDNKFIFVAAAKHCVDIGTHQHGCCVLQRCITHSTGQYRENLVAEISANGLLLAQDSFGNYVVQFILELKIPSAISNLISQFEGNYVHLATHRFSSHVVEKCLVVFNEKNRSRIIHELISVSHFERLLQDPHANYVVQTALRVYEGHLQNLLVEAIEAHRAVARNNPYAKKIFSQKILRK